VFSHCSLWPKATLWPFSYKWNTQVINSNLERFESSPLPKVLMDALSAFQGYEVLPGRLCQVLDGAGKRRIFAIGNYIKQRLLRPVHDWSMSVLRTLPCDGTYDQVRPLKRLCTLGCSEFYCYDLSSATDRWPLSVIHEVVSAIFGPTVASCTVNACLGLNSFDIRGILPKKKNSRRRTQSIRVCFTTGQPLGYYSSWPLFSLSHHYIVWIAAEKVYPGRRFTRYALLGDDIVIADKLVAQEYRNLLQLLNVKVSDAKSLVSCTGCLEFAKRFWVRCNYPSQGKDLSPVSARAVLTIRSTLGLCQLAEKYQLSYKTLFRLSGAGFRTRSRMYSPNSGRKCQRLWAAAMKPPGKSQLPLEWWIGRGQTTFTSYLTF